MSEIVKNELDTIKEFAEATEKRGSTLTLNEINYISDKQLHKKDGGGTGGVLVCTIDLQTSALDKTWNEINNATPAFVVIDGAGAKNICFVAFTANIEQVGYVMAAITWRDGLGVTELRFWAESADGYPVMQM